VVRGVEPASARARLLYEHDRLRELLAAAVAAPDLHRVLEELRLAFAAHNASEEALLVPILEEDPAWGPARIARMMEEHVAEHAALRAALNSEDVAARIADIAEEIEAHMAAEERTFLSPGVLRPAR
jgi:iron-sulfur cluster repair protein YtfE (RIC family)